ncbi:amidohydrolase family protein [Sphingosinicella sp. LHD-64]|uniref:amidohydrolase family protein n=1 Tax=Sphingosinicella sp. LHD-64 TaxID=3072139 RepID=UPI00280C7CA8|nr:amidohydrolase family protein [Sphingosinicella sp. LHD-64]MDQ8757447.1 amidohydrolase family protein [Sphingosinicella sp. LHD-64]
MISEWGPTLFRARRIRQRKIAASRATALALPEIARKSAMNRLESTLFFALAFLGMVTMLATSLSATPAAADYDLVLSNGRVMDPESGLDAIRYVGIRDGKIAAISQERISGRQEIDASGRVVAPGFIDLHAHGQRAFEAGLQALDGVTTQLELEIGVYPVTAWYEARRGSAPINFGASVGHLPIRQMILSGLTEEDMTNQDIRDRIFTQRNWVDNAASANQLAAMEQRVQQGLDEGGLGVGYGINYTAGATREEIYRMFRVARRNGVINFVHARFMNQNELGGSVDAVQEVIADAAITGAALHIVHIGSSGGGRVPLLLQMIDEARENGVDVTTEVYPYTAYSTFLGSAIFDGDFTRAQGIQYSDIELPETGERLTRERFEQLRGETPERMVIGHAMREENVAMAIAHPGVMIGSDGEKLANGKGHPRGAGTYARVLGRYVREQRVLTLMEALAKISYLPARRLEASVPAMRAKGRIRVGADADIVVFDPDTVLDRATFAEPTIPSAGIDHVLVNGIAVVRDGQLQTGVNPGLGIRR